MRTIDKVIRLLVLVLIVGMVVLPAVTLAAGTTVVQPNKPGVAVNPNIKKILEKGLGPKNDGQIANVTTTPAGVWPTGISVRVQWEWPDYVNFPADVTLWNGSAQVATIATGWPGKSVGWSVPYNLAAGTYTVRVQSSQNYNNFAETAVRIELSTLTVTGPKQGDTLYIEGTYPITWTWARGNPGPLKIELIPAAGGSPLLIANNVPWGSSSLGKFDWQIPGNVTPGSYRLRITSMGNSAMTATSQTFAIDSPVPPSITITRPTHGQWIRPGEGTQIQWNATGNPGPLRIELVSPAGSSTLIKNSADYSSVYYDYSSGSYSWYVPAGTPTADYRIRITSETKSGVTATSENFMIATFKLTIGTPYTASGGSVTAGKPFSIPCDSGYLTDSFKVEVVRVSDNAVTAVSPATVQVPPNHSTLTGLSVPATLSAGSYKIRMTKIHGDYPYGDTFESPVFTITR